ncbi:MAG: hypothetical protein ACOYJX_03640 [Acutalibacteraceae bacterium]|jgi:hypothetical protein
MKKFLFILVCLLIIVAIVIILGMKFGFGLGKGGGGNFGKGENTSNITTSLEENNPTEEHSKSHDNTTSGATILRISVIENDYFYENERISLEGFIKILQGIQEEIIVEIKDDNASLKAYNNLLSKLDEINIPFVDTR